MTSVTQARNRTLAALASSHIFLMLLCGALLLACLICGYGWCREHQLRRAEHEAVVGILEERAGLEQ